MELSAGGRAGSPVARRWSLTGLCGTSDGEPQVTVGFARAKGERTEWAVHKLTEVGVDNIYPMVTTRTVVRWDPERQARSHERMTRVTGGGHAVPADVAAGGRPGRQDGRGGERRGPGVAGRPGPARGSASEP